MSGSSDLLEFAPFVEVHADFREAVLRHQDALVRGDVAASRAEIERFAADLEDHMRQEETRILPVLETRGGWGRAGDPQFYRDEHEKLRGHVRRAVRETAALDAASADFPRRAALLIGAEQALLHLLEHHDDRETRCLYPDLLKVTTPEERRAMLE
jgi:iron-sulfur cluster repair protein YtfE (RIC family)